MDAYVDEFKVLVGLITGGFHTGILSGKNVDLILFTSA